MSFDNWKKIWAERGYDQQILDGNYNRRIFMELKKLNGFDVLDGQLDFDSFMGQHKRLLEGLSDGGRIEIQSVYEIGCGCGATLVLLEQDGIRCGGLDYSQSLVNVAKQVLKSTDISCDEAVNASTEPIYDAVISNSVFSYFPSEEYAEKVLEKMYEKAQYAIGILDIHDADKKEDFIAYRKKTVENYEERYNGLEKFFYDKSFFETFAQKHNMKIRFMESMMKNYWNNEFVFHCYMYK